MLVNMWNGLVPQFWLLREAKGQFFGTFLNPFLAPCQIIRWPSRYKLLWRSKRM